jgi:acyl-CoA synthetase (AMP-forming)/AMP-acid ligase II
MLGHFTGKLLPLGQPGQIVARVDGQMTGCWNDPEGTRERMVDGWVLTGDIGMIDKNGYLYLLDRAADMIISGGFNIWPTELENAIATHPAVMEVAVFGIPDPRWGETPCAVVVPKSGRTIDVAEVVQLCAEQLGSYKKKYHASSFNSAGRVADSSPTRDSYRRGRVHCYRVFLGRLDDWQHCQ